MTYTDVVGKIPPSKIGAAELTIDTPSSFERMRASMSGMALNREKYARLLLNGSVMMTDADFERRTNSSFMQNAHGDVLIAGLGIGLILDPITSKCNSVTVVEKSSDVIALIGPHYPSVKIVQSDIFAWQPPAGSSWDTIYFDIWPDINSDTVAEGTKLKRRYRKYLREDGWMESWSKIAQAALPRSRRY